MAVRRGFTSPTNHVIQHSSITASLGGLRLAKPAGAARKVAVAAAPAVPAPPVSIPPHLAGPPALRFVVQALAPPRVTPARLPPVQVVPVHAPPPVQHAPPQLFAPVVASIPPPVKASRPAAPPAVRPPAAAPLLMPAKTVLRATRPGNPHVMDQLDVHGGWQPMAPLDAARPAPLAANTHVGGRPGPHYRGPAPGRDGRDWQGNLMRKVDAEIQVALLLSTQTPVRQAADHLLSQLTALCYARAAQLHKPVDEVMTELTVAAGWRPDDPRLSFWQKMQILTKADTGVLAPMFFEVLRIRIASGAERAREALQRIQDAANAHLNPGSEINLARILDRIEYLSSQPRQLRPSDLAIMRHSDLRENSLRVRCGSHESHHFPVVDRTGQIPAAEVSYLNHLPPHEPWVLHEQHPFVTNCRSRDLPVRNGIPGISARILSWAEMLRCSQMQPLRDALIASAVTAGAHSVTEVCEAAAAYGVNYQPGGYWELLSAYGKNVADRYWTLKAASRDAYLS